MKRRAKDEGSLRHRKDGRWEVRLVVDGTRESIYGTSQAEVIQMAKARRKAADDGLPRLDEKRSLAAYAEEWLELKRTKLRPRTHIRYIQLLRVHVVPTLGRVPLPKLGPQHLERLYHERLEAGAAARTVRHVHAVIHNALGDATRWGLIRRNVADLVRPPLALAHQITTLDEDQVSRFVEACAGERFAALFLLAVTTGMRQGELLALRWQDVDFERSHLSVCQSLQWTKDGPVFTPPKTAKSRRNVEVSAPAIDALRSHRARQIEQRLAAAGAWEDLGLVFPNEVGRPMDGTNLNERDLRRILARAELPRIRFHDLRHTAATILLGRGVHPKVVSEMLGHADIRITLDLYSHVTPTMHREAASVFDRVLAATAR